MVRTKGLTAIIAGALAFALAGCVPADGPSAPRLSPAGTGTEALAPLPMHVGGRVVETRDAAGRTLFLRQWPGTYFETAFEGRLVVIGIGPGAAHLAVRVDGGEPLRLVHPQPGDVRLDGLDAGRHTVRVDMVHEDQEAPSGFHGFFAPAGVTPLAPPSPERQIEFVGDSWTVGYANTSTRRECDAGTVWATTDTARGIAGLVAGAIDADYRVHAMSGRGVVRNYNGGAGDTLPEAYPFALFDRTHLADDAGWRPHAVIVSLGTNDFSTPLRAGEPWPDRTALEADFVATYADFLATLRQHHPQADIIVWASADNAIVAEASRRAVAARLADGDGRIEFLAVEGLGLGACHHHPDLADDRRIAEALLGALAVR